MENSIEMVWVTTTSWDHELPFKIKINYIIK
jgi:hypothetical protein